MTVQRVTKLIQAFDEAGIDVWVDGGWGVDALLGKQSRSHKDLDIAIQQNDLHKLMETLQTRGFREKGEAHARPWNFILTDNSGLEVDVHVINIDQNGDGIYGPPENGEKYPESALTGKGVIGGFRVKCVSAEDAVKFHSGYELKEKDFQDVLALCKKFNIELPKEYRSFL